MNKEKYQIKEKANYLNLLILTDELKSYHNNLSVEISNTNDWLTKLRNIRNVFVSLNNVRDIMQEINLNISDDYVKFTRELKKKLVFANYFRNKASGHLDKILLERAVQWHPQIFSFEAKENEKIKIAEAHRAIIEACINSFITNEGKQKVFNTEIDLMYPPNLTLFLSHLEEIVSESIEWLTTTSEHLLLNIKHYKLDEMIELSAIAGKTNFNLNEDSEYSFTKDEVKIRLAEVIKGLESINAKQEIIDFVRDRFTNQYIEIVEKLEMK